MPPPSDASLDLSEYLTHLQAALSEAGARAEMDDHTFRVDGITVEVDVSYTPTRSADSPTGVAPEFRLLSLAPQARSGSDERHVQRLTVHLSRVPEVSSAEPPDGVAATSLLPPTPLTEFE